MLTELATVFLLIVLFPQIQGNKRVFTVTCDLQIGSNDENFYGSGSGSGNSSGLNTFLISIVLMATVPIYSFDHLLKNLTSDSVMNITCNVELSSVITLANLTSISIIGHNNPTVDYNNYGGLYFSSCLLKYKVLFGKGVDLRMAITSLLNLIKHPPL